MKESDEVKCYYSLLKPLTILIALHIQRVWQLKGK